MRLLIWGTGGAVKNMMAYAGKYWQGLDITGYLDSDGQKWGSRFEDGKEIYSPSRLPELPFDKLIICNAYYEEIKSRILREYPETEPLLEDRLYLVQQLMSVKYRDSKEPDILATLEYWKANKISPFNQHIAKKEALCEVWTDQENGMPYISVLGGRRMYYTRNYEFIVKDGRKYVMDPFTEQSPDSPHLYLYGEHQVKEGGVVVDAGCGEGNFALSVVDRASRLYLIESDPAWVEALKLTFRGYEDKVVICGKMLSNNDGIHTVTLDTLVREPVDFIKMDIEGGEVEALLGAEEVFRKSRLKCSVCAYHRCNDARDIQRILSWYGCRAHVSNKYMTFIYDYNLPFTLDFRHGIVYGSRDE